MQAIGLSDELAMVRSRMAILRRREAALCAELEDGDLMVRTGQWTWAEVVERRLRLFDHRLLPLEMQAESAFWVERVQREVSCRLRDGARVPMAMRRAEIAPPPLLAPGLSESDALVIARERWV